MKIPQTGMARETLFEQMQAYRAQDLETHGGRTWAYVYDSGRRELEEVARQAYTMFLSENALDPTAFPSLLRFENELVAMSAAHLNGDAEVVGNFTSGGTESCMLAVKTARDHARAHKPHITAPEMILPVTAHAAFHKAAHYMDVKAVVVPVDPVSFRVDPEAVRQAITPNTILLVGSASNYAYGVVDPIEALGHLALEHDLLFHVDGCIGGFLLPYFRRLGAPVPPFDFSVPGVTSISMDLHKYAFTPKGASVILYRNRALRRHQIFACAGWTGYTIINPTLQSTKSGGPLAAAWAVMHFIGDDGYLELARRTLEASRRIIAGIEAIDGLRVNGRPEMSLVSFTSDHADVFHIVDEMKARRWYVQPQLGFHGHRENIHLTITPTSLDRVDALLADLQASVEAAKSLGSSPMAAMAMEAVASMDISRLDDALFAQLLSFAGVEGQRLPERMAAINQLLNALPPAAAEQILAAFVNNLFVQPAGQESGADVP